jgi:hypothetical protein
MSLASILSARNSQNRIEGTPSKASPVRIAQTRAEREGAFKILYRTYLQAGLAEPNAHGMRVTPYHLLPSTSVFITEHQSQIVATVTLCQDGCMGLPIESLYPEKVSELRASGAKLAEVCCLADRRRDAERGLDAMISLTKLVFHYAQREDVDYLLCVAHPRHGRFYKRATGMVAFDEIRACPYVKNRPAEPLLLDLKQLASDPPRLYSKYFEKDYAAEALDQSPMTLDEVFHFSQFLDDETQLALILEKNLLNV